MPRSTVKSLRALFSISSLRSGQAVLWCPEYRGTSSKEVTTARPVSTPMRITADTWIPYKNRLGSMIV